MPKRASKPRKRNASSTSASTKSPSKPTDGKMVLRVKTTEKTKKSAEKPTTTSCKKKKKKKASSKIDALKPKKPPTAFFYFLEDFRKEFQENNPDVKSMRDIGKACGEKWKTMTYEEKVNYYDIATEKRAEFDRATADFIKRKESGELQEYEEDSDFDESDYQKKN